MKTGYKKIFWGLLLAFFNIKFDGIIILPSFIGWIIVFDAFKDINIKAALGKAKFLCSVLIIMSILFEVARISNFDLLIYDVMIFTPFIVSIVELLLIHVILEATVNNYADLNQNDNVEKYTEKTRVYIIFKGIEIVFMFLICLNQNIIISYIEIFISIVLNVYLLTIIYSVKKEMN